MFQSQNVSRFLVVVFVHQNDGLELLVVDRSNVLERAAVLFLLGKAKAYFDDDLLETS